MKTSLILSLLLLSGCCSIVDSQYETVSFNSNAPKTSLKITDSKNKTVYSGQAPISLSLDKKRGFFSGETYTIKAEKKGYTPTEKVLETRMNGWYWGNIIFGGLIGALIVDPATGAMWTFKENDIMMNLDKTSEK